MVKDSKAPLSFVKDDIRNIILNKRKIKLIQQMQEDAYKEVLDRKDAEIFYEK
jgi:predicted house-cleaning noncanonical NTP pyrophosphatase (MazG superfamily)